MAANLHDLTLKATNHPNKRTVGAHLGDIFNVQGFGAVGDTNTDDTTAIQAAVDACLAAGGGTVYFPRSSTGIYKTTAPITFNNDSTVGIRFLGEIDATRIAATFSGFVLDRSLATPNNTLAPRIIERMFITNNHATGGGVRIGSSIGAVIRDCKISGQVAITTEDEEGVSSESTQILSCVLAGSGNYVGSNGIIIGGGGSITGTDFRGFNVGLRAYGSGLYVGGGRTERCSVGMQFGLDSGDNDVGMKGLAVHGHSFEGHWTAIDFVGTCSGVSLGGIGITGHDTNTGPTGSTSVGDTPEAHPTEWGVRIRADALTNAVIYGVSVSGDHDEACIEIEDATARTNVLIGGCTATQSGGAGVSWVFPTKADTAKFMQCNEMPVYTYATLPASPFEGEEWSITDSNTTTWGDTVASGGGSGNVLVRYNGTAWTVVGI